jgi:hypothetical protein
MALRLLSRARRPAAGGLVAVALGQAAAAAGTAEALRLAMETPAHKILAPASVAVLLAGATALAVLGERWIGERLAQSFVADARRALFESVIASPGRREARWITSFVGDLAALRNWAARGPVRLATASLAGLAAACWFAYGWPREAAALLPLVTGAGAMLLCCGHLAGVIEAQRRERGSLTRFLIRRLRAEIGSRVSPSAALSSQASWMR